MMRSSKILLVLALLSMTRSTFAFPSNGDFNDEAGLNLMMKPDSRVTTK